MPSLIKNKENYIDWLVAIFFVALPFTYALTWNIGFPLKISELSLILILFAYLATAPKLLDLKFTNSFYSFFIAFFIFFLIAVTSFIINSNCHFPYSIDIPNVRYNPVLQSLSKTIYLLLSGIATFIAYQSFSSSKQSFYLKALNIGCLLSALFGWYLFIFSINQLPVYILPGMDIWPQHGLYSFGHFIRCGTFKEGNYAGLYFVSIFFINLQFKKYKWASVALLGCIPTFSSIAFAILLLTSIIFILKKSIKLRKVLPAIVLISLLLGLGMVFIKTKDIVFITSKVIPTDEEQFKDANNSRLERLNLINSGFEIAKNNPFFGVGLANFSKHFQHYNSSKSVNKRNIQYIANNIYLEILSELGFPGLVSFLILMYILFKTAIKQRATILNFGLVAMLIYFMAYPSFTLLFIWVYFGIILSFTNQNADLY